MCQHGLNHVRIDFWLNQIQERMLRTIGVPQRKSRVIHKSIGLMNALIQSFVTVINIHVQGWS